MKLRRNALLCILIILGFIALFRHLQPSSSQSSVDPKEVPASRLSNIRTPLTFIEYSDGRALRSGIPFDASLSSYLKSFKIDDESTYEQKPFKADDIVIVMYSNSPHFAKSKAGIMNWRKFAKKNKIVYYDVGLREDERQELRSVCNLELRTLDFGKYPESVRNLDHYRFKPVVVAEVFAEFPAFLAIDSSIRFIDGIEPFAENMSLPGMIPYHVGGPSGHSIYAVTHKSMFGYLPMVDERAYGEEHCADAGFIRHSQFAKEAVKWNVLCALTTECMGPTGSTMWCRFDPDRYRKYANCHRYDQSAINIIVSSLNEREKNKYTMGRFDIGQWMVNERFDSHGGPMIGVQCEA